MKYPVVIPYIHTRDCGLELKHSLRTLRNMANWNGDVYVVGDKEAWFSDKVKYIALSRTAGAYVDQVKKLLKVIELMPEKFISSMDDIYVTEPTKIGVYYKGELDESGKGIHARSKKFTQDILTGSGLTDLKDYECHAPMLVETDMLRETLEFIVNQPQANRLQWRSIYGNTTDQEAVLFEDKKTKTTELMDGAIISTNFYTPELYLRFPNKSEFERE